MKLKNYFNILMYSFLLIVPLIPLKAKILFFPLSADFIIGGFAILIGVIDLIVNYKKERDKFSILKDKKIRVLTILIIVFMFISLFSIIYASSKTAVISEALRFMEYVIIFYLILLNADSRFINRGLMLFYISMLVSAAFGILQFTFNLSTFEVGGYLNRGRVYATFENPNYWGAAVNLIIFFPLISLIENKKDKKSINLVIFIVLLANLVLSFTRGSWLGFALGLLFLAVIRYRKWLLALPFIAGGSMLIPFIRDRLLSILQFKDTTLGRIKLWKTGWYMFKDHFWIGVGNGNFLTNYPEYIKKHPTLTVYKDQASVHNSYLKMLAELGIFGGLIFTGIYGMMFYMTISLLKETKKYKIHVLAILGFWIAYLFQNLLNNLMFIPQLNVFVWIITAMLYKGVYLENQEEKNEYIR
ncbi:MAG: O-antigen ligase family protein [Clostridiales bacterium]|nr:O-antigen ligase family protein [Clostridiales bacterium]